MKTIELNESQYPLVVIRYAAQVDESEFDELLRGLDRLLQRGRQTGARVCLLYDASSGYAASPAVRKKQSDWMRQHSLGMSENVVGVAMVINSPLVRGVLTAVLWVTKIPVPYTVAGTFEEARRWCLQRLDSARRGTTATGATN